MAIAQAKTSRARRDKRRSHHHLTSAAVCVCSNCQHLRLTHTVCSNCGFYKGREVIKLKEE